ncbi:MAG: peptidyl-tRNA hydrolase Pth2 [Conexivisphaerales archaeon]
MSEFAYKQVIAVRNDIKMGKGKLAAQVAHAAVSSALEAQKEHREWFREWLNEGQAKIVVKVSSEDELRRLKEMADDAKLPSSLIVDRGLTQLEPGTVTCLGIGPAPSQLVDKLTGKLKLL